MSRTNTGGGDQLFYISPLSTLTNTSYPLLEFTSQLTGNSTTCISRISGTARLDVNERYTNLGCNLLTVDSAELRQLGFLLLGNGDKPMGFYDVAVYNNPDPGSYPNINLDPTGLTILWRGLMNLTASDDFPAIQYTEYTTNDSDIESVYITNKPNN